MKNVALALLLAAPASAAAPSGEAALSAAFETLQARLHAKGEVGLPREGVTLPRPKGGCSLPETIPGAWGQIVAKVCAKGAYRPGDGMISATRGLELVAGDRKRAHRADYVNLWGQANESETLKPGEATFVSEDWVIEPDGLWHIDQWVLKLRLDGTLYSVYHGYLVEEMTGRVRDSGSYRAEIGDPKTTAKHDALLALWTGFQP